MAGVINKDGRMVVGPKAEIEAAILKERNKNKKSYKDAATYKAMGGNVAKYYGKGGKVAGCGPAQNKS
jgi:hypothetical protein